MKKYLFIFLACLIILPSFFAAADEVIDEDSENVVEEFSTTAAGETEFSELTEDEIQILNKRAEDEEGGVAKKQSAEGVVDCFDYYNFGSVQVDITSAMEQVVPGVPLTFNAKITNNNQYPIVDGAAYVKVFRKNIDEKETQNNGHNLVEQFFIVENISLPANGVRDVEFVWQVPFFAMGGDYQIVSFFTSAKKFNLLGLSFTDDVVGNSFDFKVTSEDEKGVFLEKSSVTTNEREYLFAAYPPRFDVSEAVKVSADLINSTDEEQQVFLKWTLYTWDAQSEENVIETKEETVLLSANERKNLSHEIPPQNHPVSYLVLEASNEDAKSILNIRMARIGTDKLRLNFPALTNYPLENGKTAGMFSCLHNSGNAQVVSGGKLEMILRAENGDVIEESVYEGEVTGEMMAIKKNFVPKQDYTNFTLTANLYQDGELVDNAEMKYDCKSINASLCQNVIEESKLVSAFEQENIQSKIWFVILGLIALVGVITIILFIRYKRQSLAILAGLIIAGSFFLGANETEAKSVSANALVKNFSIGELVSPSGKVMESSRYSIGSFYVNVNYGVIARNLSNGALLSDGNTVSVGQTISLQKTNSANTDISWFATGYYSDSPYGHWVAGANTPVPNITDYIQFNGFLGGRLILTPSVNPPALNLNKYGTAGLTCNKISASRFDCLVNSPGSIQLNSVIAATYGYFYAGGSFNEEDCCGYGSQCGLFMDDYKFVFSDYKCRSWSAMLGAYNFGRMPMRKASASLFNFPSRTIPFYLTAVGPTNRAPNPPTITGVTTGTTNTLYPFTARATDPDGDKLRYGFDWNNDSVIDLWTPYVNSGTNQTSSYKWIPAGAKTFKVLAQDIKGANSTWASHAVNIAAPPPPPTLSLSANPISVTYGDSTNVSWSTTNATSCSSAGDWTNGWRPVNGSEMQNSITSSKTFTMQCWSATGVSTGIKSVTLNYSCIPDNNCSARTINWSGTCTGDCNISAKGSETGICTNGCGGAGMTTRDCKMECPVEFGVDGYRETAQ